MARYHELCGPPTFHPRMRGCQRTLSLSQQDLWHSSAFAEYLSHRSFVPFPAHRPCDSIKHVQLSCFAPAEDTTTSEPAALVSSQHPTMPPIS